MIPVMGHFKAGKSTFLNALLGENLLCSDVLPATAAVTVLTYGPRKQLKAFFPDRPPHSFAFDTLREMSSEGGDEWRNLRQQLSYLEVALPHPLLKQVTLVDTPGLNSIHGLHSRVTNEFIERADGIIWLFACPQVGTKTELDEIRKLPQGCRPYAVVNQIDLLDPDEQPIDEFLDDVARRLGDSTHPPVGVSAKFAVDADNGAGGEMSASSRWDSFVQVFEKGILAGGTQRKETRLLERIEVALNLVLAFVEAKRDEIRNTATELVQGKEYEQNIQQRIQDLAQLARSWRQTPDLDSADLIISAPALTDDVDGVKGLNQHRDLLGGVLEGFVAESEEMAREGQILEANTEAFQKRLAIHLARCEEYNHSGLFGGPPVLFGGGKRKTLEAEETKLKRRAEQIDLRASRAHSEAALFESRLERVTKESDEFTAEVYGAIIQGIKKLENDLEHRDEVQVLARLKIEECRPVRTLLRELGTDAVTRLEKCLREVAANPSERRLIAIADRLNRLGLCADVIEDEIQASESASTNSPRGDRISAELEHGTDAADRVQPQNSAIRWVPGWKPVMINYVLAATIAIMALWYLVSRHGRPAEIVQSKTSNVVSAPPPHTPIASTIPDDQTIHQLVFPTQPDNLLILQTVYGNVNGPGQSAIWSASQLPPQLDRSRLLVQAADSFAFRVVYSEELIDSNGVHRLFIAIAGSGIPLENFTCHACAAILGVVILRQEVSGWRIEAVNRVVAVDGANGKLADQYSIVGWGADRYGLLLRLQTSDMGGQYAFATLVGQVNEIPRVIGTFDVAHDDCGVQHAETAPCRSETSDMSFEQSSGDVPWDLYLRKQVTKGLGPGEPLLSVKTFRFDGETYKEVQAADRTH